MMMTINHSTIQQSYFQVFNIFQISSAVDLDEFDHMMKGVSHGYFHIGTYIKPERRHLPEKKWRADVDAQA